jgi:hypothetical protein
MVAGLPNLYPVIYGKKEKAYDGNGPQSLLLVLLLQGQQGSCSSLNSPPRPKHSRGTWHNGV